MMNIIKPYFFLLIALTTLCTLSAVELVEEQNKLIICNKHYRITFNKLKGYTISHVAVGSIAQPFYSNLIFSYDGQQKKYDARPHSSRPDIAQSAQKVSYKILSQNEECIKLRFSWVFTSDGTVEQTVTFTNTPVIEFETQVGFKQALHNMYYEFYSNNMNPEKTFFYPGNVYVPGVKDLGAMSATPHYKFSTDGRMGFGLIAPENQKWEKFVYFSQIPGPFMATLVKIQLHREKLHHEPIPGQITSRHFLVLGPDAQKAEALCRAQLPNLPEIEIVEQNIEKVISKIGGENAVSAMIVNHGREPRTFEVRPHLEWGIDSRKDLPTTSMTLMPGEVKKYQTNWTFDRNIKWGVAVHLSIICDGKVIDHKADTTSVTNFAPAAAGVGVYNPGFCYQDRHVKAWADQMKRTFLGVVEYYGWAEGTWDPSGKIGLAHKGEIIEPHTDQTVAFRRKYTKKFLTGFIDESHKQGIHIYSWITGLLNYKIGLENPKFIQYCENGQPSIYAGRIWDGTRFAVVKIAPYDIKTSAEWGRQMVESIKMFKWDGCRWDWGFVPSEPNDPLFHGAANVPSWYNYQGKSAKTLYPDPDKVGAECLAAWREEVEAFKPDFVYSTNCRVDEMSFGRVPQYNKVMTKNSLLLLEYLMNLTQPGWNTFEKWGKHLTTDTQRVRPNGAQTEVGLMHRLNESTSEQIARYVCYASGCKWWGGPAEYRYWGQKRRSMPFMIRFAEYFFDNNFMLLPENRRNSEVSVSPEKELFFRQFIYERPKDNGREMTVHIINIRPDLYISMYQPEIQTKKNVKISVKLHRDEKITSAFALVPGPVPHAIPLTLEKNQVTLPQLDEAAVIVFRMTK